MMLKKFEEKINIFRIPKKSGNNEEKITISKTGYTLNKIPKNWIASPAMCVLEAFFGWSGIYCPLWEIG